MKLVKHPSKGVIELNRKIKPRPPVQVVREEEKQEKKQEDIIAVARELAKEIAASIVSEIRKLKTVHIPQSDAVVHSEVKIDESILDVGIGQTDELKKGKYSKNIDKEEVIDDTSFSSAASKLRNLKKRGPA